jgi:hypothetical protein
MKKYIKPTVEVIEMETAMVIAESPTLSQQGDFSEGQSVLESRRRGDAWSEYDGIE